MSQVKEFIIKQTHVLNDKGDKRSETIFPLIISNYEKVLKELKTFLSAPGRLTELLKKDFIYPGSLGERSYSTYRSLPKRTRRVRKFHTPIRIPPSGPYINYHVSPHYWVYEEEPDHTHVHCGTVIYAKYKVASVLEELVLNHPAYFRSLLASADEQTKKIFLDFTHLDLSLADLTQLDFSLINFTGCSLRNTKGITQDLLDKSLTYVGAQLPEGMVAAWSNEQKYEVLKRIQELSLYSRKLSKSWTKEGIIKGNLALAVGKELTDKINQTEKFHGAFQKEFLKLLQKHETTFNKRRYHSLKLIISNLILFVLGLGVIYISAGLIHHHQTGRFFFFQRSTTQQKIAGIQECFYSNALK